MAKNAPIFIVGCPRSGTTLLASVLNRHAEIASSSETHFFHYVSKQNINWHNFDLNELEKLLEKIRIQDFLTVAKIAKQEFIDNFKNNAEKDITASNSATANKRIIFDLMMEIFLKKRNKSIFCEKTPQHLLNLDEILDTYPLAKFINIIRDGRDTVNSLLKMPWRPNSILANSNFWNKYAKLALKINDDEKYQKNFLIVKYEDLLLEPQTVVEKICAFLEIDFQSDMLSPTAFIEQDDIFANWESEWKRKSVEKIDPKNIGVWKNDLSAEEQKFLNYLTKTKLKAFAYPVENESFSLTYILKYLAELKTALSW